MNSSASRPTLESDTNDPILLRARQALYRLGSLALADPRVAGERQGRLALDRELLIQAARLVRESPTARVERLNPGEKPLDDLPPEELLDGLPSSIAEWNLEYERVFGLVVAGDCTPYETEYVDGKLSEQRAQMLADVSGFYRAFGMQPSVTHPERPDHVTLELEFMAVLIDLECRAMDASGGGESEIASRCRSAQRRFLSEHLAWWVPAFAKLLAHRAGPGFLAGVAGFLAAWIPAERGLLGIAEPGPVHVSPPSFQRPEECEGCLLHNE